MNQAVNTTTKAVGGAITNAKGALSSWWSSVTTHQAQQLQQEPATMAQDERHENVDDDDLEIVASVPVAEDFSVSVSNRGDGRGGEGTKGGVVQEIGMPAEEFLESEVEVARQEVPPGTDDMHTRDSGRGRTEGGVFTV